jgi:hemolysin III
MVEPREPVPGENIRPQSLGEEIANAVSHGIGLIGAMIGSPFLLIAAARRGGPAVIVGVSVFAMAVMLLYLTSTLYHALPASRAKRVFRVIDHGAIFLLIAGTYTPFTLGVLRGGWGWTIFGLVWGLAILGICVKAIAGIRFPALSTCLYIGMGWLALIAIRPIWLHMPTPGVLWLVAGGVAYTAGVAFYAFDRVRYLHFVWHLFVIAGTVCHFVAVLNYSA